MATVTTDWTDAGTCEQAAGAETYPWTDPANGRVSDNSYASAGASGLTPGAYTTRKLVARNFGISIPAGATIDGIEFQVEHKGGGSQRPTWTGAWVRKADGTVGATNKAASGTVPSSDTYEAVGADDDLWGESWTAADFADADTGLVIQYTHPGSATDPMVYVDNVQARITYTEAVAPARDPMTGVQAVC